jgi:hypothetical protein
MGGGMEAGVNIWRALRNNSTTHPAWAHLKHAPLTESDLPRAITAMKPGQNPAEQLASKPAAAAVAAAAIPRPAAAAAEEEVKGEVVVLAPLVTAAAAGGGMVVGGDIKPGSVVRRKTTVEVVACDADEEFAAA